MKSYLFWKIYLQLNDVKIFNITYSIFLLPFGQ